MSLSTRIPQVQITSKSEPTNQQSTLQEDPEQVAKILRPCGKCGTLIDYCLPGRMAICDDCAHKPDLEAPPDPMDVTVQPRPVRGARIYTFVLYRRENLNALIDSAEKVGIQILESDDEGESVSLRAAFPPGTLRQFQNTTPTGWWKRDAA